MGRKEKGRKRRREEGKETDRQEEGGSREEKKWSPQNAIFIVLTSKALKLTSCTKPAWNSRTLYSVLL